MGYDKSKIKNHYPSSEEERAQMVQPYASALCYKTFKLEVVKEYFYCACALSKSQPFCDCSHEGTKFLYGQESLTKDLSLSQEQEAAAL